MNRRLKILQKNMRKFWEMQHSLFNDDDLKEFSLILLTEPNHRMEEEGLIMPATAAKETSTP